MHEPSGAYRAFETYARGGPAPGIDASQLLSGPRLLHADEHTVARTLFLAALCARLEGGTSVTGDLMRLAQDYEEASFLYTGRIMPRFKEMMALLDRAVDQRCPQTLVEVADHLSQGWPAYATSVFPVALARLAGELGSTAGTASFATTSFTCWRDALAAAADGRPDAAAPLFRESLERYRTYLYYADTAWLFTDLVINQLTQGQMDQAAETCNEQSRYVAQVLTRFPASGDESPLFQLGEVHSGGYSTFVESITLRPHGLTEQDRAILRRYVRTSELLLTACRYHSERDFDAALDLFSFGWTTFRDTPYPRIFEHLAAHYADTGQRWNVQLTAYVRWHCMLRAGRVGPTSRELIETAVALHDRLVHAGMLKEAGIALLDAVTMHAHLHGKSAAVEWISRYTRELRPEVPDLLSAAIDYLQTQEQGSAGTNDSAQWAMARYVGLRSHHTVPELVWHTPFQRHPAQPVHVEVALYDRLLSIEGITIYEQTPEPLVEILLVLGEEFVRSRTGGCDVPLVSAAELSARTSRSTAALAQTVRRFRTQTQERFQQATTFIPDAETVIQGRPGYRLNSTSVESFHYYSAHTR